MKQLVSLTHVSPDATAYPLVENDFLGTIDFGMRSRANALCMTQATCKNCPLNLDCPFGA